MAEEKKQRRQKMQLAAGAVAMKTSLADLLLSLSKADQKRLQELDDDRARLQELLALLERRLNKPVINAVGERR